MVDTGDNYIPEERMLDKVVMKSTTSTPTRNPGILLDAIPEHHNARRAKQERQDNYLADGYNISVVSGMSTESHVQNFQAVTISPSYYQSPMIQQQMMLPPQTMQPQMNQ
eukprot:11913725-Ditylum_brightwellii.AAC.1